MPCETSFCAPHPEVLTTPLVTRLHPGVPDATQYSRRRRNRQIPQTASCRACFNRSLALLGCRTALSNCQVRLNSSVCLLGLAAHYPTTQSRAPSRARLHGGGQECSRRFEAFKSVP